MYGCYSIYREKTDGPILHRISWDDGHNGFFAEVDPSTVGQFTGLHDREGKKIFEGDVISLFNPEWLGGEPCKEIVEFKDGAFWSYENSPKYGKCYGDHCLGNEMTDPELEVMIIGNIHDNPELIKP